jgi:hypothetical protein
MKDILIRALKTFIQAFLGALAITLPNANLSDGAVLKSILIGALASAISALMNFVIQLMNKEDKNGSNES